jgi:hypothetical protein
MNTGADATMLPLHDATLPHATWPRPGTRWRRRFVAGRPVVAWPAVWAGGALATIALVSALIVVGAAGAPSFLSATTRPEFFPGWMAGPFGGLWPGLADSGALKVLFSGGLVLAYAAYVLLLRHVGQVRVRTLVATIAFVHLILLLAPPLTLTDVFNYFNYARMEVVHHLNPYATMPVLEPHSDPAYALSNWHGLLSPYGPLFTIFTFALAQLSVGAYLWAYKGVLLLADVGVLVLTWRCARLLGRDPAQAIALVGLNPVVLIWGLGADHNDFFTVLFVMVGLYCLLLQRARLRSGAGVADGASLERALGLRRMGPRRVGAAGVSMGDRAAAVVAGERVRAVTRWLVARGGLDAAAGGALVVATGFKASAGVLIPLVLASLARDRRRLLAVLVGVVSVGAVALGASVVAFGLHFPDLTVQGTLVIALSLPNLLGLALGQGGETATLHSLVTVALVGALVGAFVLAWRRREALTAAGWATLALIVTLAWVLPWYVLWLLPFAALARSRRLRVATLVLGAYLLLAWIPATGELLSGIGFQPQKTAVGRLHARAVQELLF